MFGWVEKTELGSKKQSGLFTGFDITMEKIEEMILHSRMKLGWIADVDEEDLENNNDTTPNEIEDSKIELAEKLANARILK